MNRFVKRFMGMRHGEITRTEQPLIALPKDFVTVRQMFSDGPAGDDRAALPHFGGDPFRLRRLHDLAGGY